MIKFEKCLKLIESFLKRLEKKLFSMKFLKNVNENYANEKTFNLNKEKNQYEEIDKRLNKILYELSQINLMCQNKFNYLEKKIDSIDSINN